MVAGLSRKKKLQAPFIDKLSENVDALRKTADELTAAIDRDASSYDAVMAAFKMPQGNDEEKAAREAAVQAATKGASESADGSGRESGEPGGTVGTTGRNLGGIHEVRPAGGASNGVAGAKGALANVEINLEGLKDVAYVRRCEAKLTNCASGWAEDERVA